MAPETEKTPDIEAAPKPAAPAPLPDPSISLPETFDRLWGSIKSELAPAKAAVKEAEAGVKTTFETRIRPAAEELERSLRTPLPDVPVAKPLPEKADISSRPMLSADTKQALPALVQGLGLIAQMIVGMRGAPAVALKGVTGAMDGWREGDRDRAQREWRSYLEAVDQIKYENELALRKHDAAMKAAGTNTARAQALFVASMTELDMPQFALAAAKQDMATTYQDLKMSLDITSMLEQNSLKATMAEYSHQMNVSRERHLQEQDRLKGIEVADKHREAQLLEYLTGGLTPGAAAPGPGAPAATPGGTPAAGKPAPPFIQDLAKQVNQGRPISEVMTRFGKVGVVMGLAVQNEAFRQRQEAGDSPGMAVLRSSFLKANRDSLTKITKEEAEYKTFLTSFEETVGLTKRLSDKVDRTSVPAWNRRQIEYQANIKGDPDAKNLLSNMETLAREADRVFSRSRGAGAEHSREQVRKLFDPGMTKGQFDSLIANVLVPDAQFGLKGFETEKAALQERIEMMGSWTPGKSASPGGGGAGGTTPKPSAESKTFTLPDGTKVTVTP